jgi:hypothetical protein
MPGSSNRFKIHFSKDNPKLAEKDCTGFSIAENNYELRIWSSHFKVDFYGLVSVNTKSKAVTPRRTLLVVLITSRDQT